MNRVLSMLWGRTAGALAVAACLLLVAAHPARGQFELPPPLGQPPQAGSSLSTIEPLGQPALEYSPEYAPDYSAGEFHAGESGPPGDYFDLDAYIAANVGPRAPCEGWCWQLLPSGIIYKDYLADTKASRLGTQVFDERTQGLLWDSTLGGHVGLLRLGTVESAWPQGWQLDLEGSGQVRLDPDYGRDLESADFRVGLPLTYGYGPHRLKLGYYHLSAHTGDEFLVRNPGFERVNYVRDVFILGYAYYWTDNLRLYGETGWAFYTDVSEEWEFRFGAEWAPARPTGLRGAPFFAVHTYLREEANYSGNLVVQAGWAWRGDRTSHLMRAGFHYHNGLSNQLTFYNRFEEQIGAGLWYDF